MSTAAQPFDRHLIRYGMNFVPRLIARARGTLLWDTDGKEILLSSLRGKVVCLTFIVTT